MNEFDAATSRVLDESQALSLLGASRGAMSRRGFVATSLCAGFALAVRPAAAGTIATDADGLEAGAVDIPVDGGRIPAYRARPAGKTEVPVVLVVQEIFGVHEYIRDICRRLAKSGYFAVAPELYARQGDVSGIASVAEILKSVVSRVPDAQVMADLDATLRWAGQSGADTTRAAITGFCWGGRIVWLYTAQRPAMKCGVAWYGRLAGAPTELQPRSPIDSAESLRVPVLGLYGGKDEGIPSADVERMRAVLARGASRSELVVYPDAPHGFHADYRPSYRAEAAADGWSRALAWLRAAGL
jgi:carboxymethylenebutenolidase